MIEFCKENGISYKVVDDRQVFKKKNRKIEWWPASNKLVFNRDWGKAAHIKAPDEVKKWILHHLKTT